MSFIKNIGGLFKIVKLYLLIHFIILFFFFFCVCGLKAFLPSSGYLLFC